MCVPLQGHCSQVRGSPLPGGGRVSHYFSRAWCPAMAGGCGTGLSARPEPRRPEATLQAGEDVKGAFSKHKGPPATLPG